MANEISKQIYKPSMNVGQLYAKVRGSAALALPVGNVLELMLEHDEEVISQPDMTALGGGTYAELRRVKSIKLGAKMSDLNVVNLSRAVFGLSSEKVAGNVAAEVHTITLGGLIRLAHIQPTAVVMTLATLPVSAAGNFEVRPEGIYVLPGAIGLSDGDEVSIAYSHGAYAVIEALTTGAVELALTFGGLNEADGGKPVVVDIYRASQGIAKKLALVNKEFGSLEIEGAVMMDPTKSGAGVSRYYKVSMA